MEECFLIDLVRDSPTAQVFLDRLQNMKLDLLGSGQNDLAYVSEVDLDNLEVHELGVIGQSCVGLLVVSCLAPSALIVQRHLRKLKLGAKRIRIPFLRRNSEPLSLVLQLHRKNAEVESMVHDFFVLPAENGYSAFALLFLSELDDAGHALALLETHLSYLYLGKTSTQDIILDMALLSIVPRVFSKVVFQFLVQCAAKCCLSEIQDSEAENQLLVAKIFRSVSSHMIVAVGMKLSDSERLSAHLKFAFGDCNLFEFPNVEFEVHVGIVYKALESDFPGTIYRIPFGPTCAAKTETLYPKTLNGTVLFPKMAAGAKSTGFDLLKQRNFGGAAGPKFESDGARVKKQKENKRGKICYLILSSSLF